MSKYSEIRKQMAADSTGSTGSTGANDALPCRCCGQPTPRLTLSTLGAQCRPCFEQAQRRGFSGSSPAPQCAQARWVREAAEAYRTRRAQITPPQSAMSDLAERLTVSVAARTVPRGLDDDAVNAMLGGV